MEREKPYCFGKVVELPFEQAVDRVRQALAARGFGILTEIDVQAKFKEKLGAEFRPYLILGACNPRLAHRALSHEIDLGTLLPCNVVVYREEEGRTVVMAMDPVGAMQAVANPALEPLAGEVRDLLRQALAEL